MSVPVRLAEAAAVVAAYLACCGLLVWRRRAARARSRRAAAGFAPAERGVEPLLIAFASQTGFAEQLAWQTARALQAVGVPARLRPLGELDAEDLAHATRVLFIVSTYGEGDAPDPAAGFVRRVMASGVDLATLEYGLLALGDRGYANFCGFGRRLDAWLVARHAQPLFERVELDNADALALRLWHTRLAALAGQRDLPDWQLPAFETWPLNARRLLNEGSAGHPLFQLELGAPPGARWEAGDLLQVLAPGDPARPREYSIASLPADGALHLLVRQERPATGEFGVASGWLTRTAAIGSGVQVQLRPNRNFRIDANVERPLLLIGNGSGFAGLRAHLKARAAQGASVRRPCWLLFGERHAAHDGYFADEIAAWRASGVLAHADLVFSRDGPQPRYVQHALLAQRERLAAWLADGVAIYVCGSLEGMAAGVDDALQTLLGADALRRLAEQGRYRRDVY
ncbi:MAG TPA: sulfite reductase subunit alpha [Burkholderiaceae bacterium]